MLLIKSLFSQSADKKVATIVKRAKKNNPHQVKKVLLLQELFFWTSLAGYLIYGGYLTCRNYKSHQTAQFLYGFAFLGLGIILVGWLRLNSIFKYLQKLSSKTGAQSP